MSCSVERTSLAGVSFDVDGTLTRQNSWLALTEGLGASSAEHATIYERYSRGVIDYLSAKHQLLTLWNETGHATKPYITQVLCSLPLRPEAREVVDWLKAKEYKVCLISGSMDVYVSIVAKQLGVNVFYANTTLIFDQRGSLVDLEYFLDQGSRKVEQLKSFCDLTDTLPEQIVAVGNSENDMGLFQLTRRGLLLEETPSPQLRDRSWGVIESLSDIKNFLPATQHAPTVQRHSLRTGKSQFC